MPCNSEMTPEEQKAAEEKKAMIEKAKARGAEKAKLTKSMIILDVKPWDDTTGRTPFVAPIMFKLHAAALYIMQTARCTETLMMRT